ncbi:hypothetical protein NC653_037138 [Populus alba x Populus x berolinensis]|uniref:Uncharacterized protein n=1 Tax=Populus alba x Populus x berolinensis TaxID=444605 RepID=A0AAD6LLS8_9ROSI|nr:hypothetical protein NC653_037138 [Populus alba x Populus x berolinensis]
MAKKLYPKMSGRMLPYGLEIKLRPRRANRLPQLLLEGKAIRIEINPPIIVSGKLEFY